MNDNMLEQVETGKKIIIHISPVIIIQLLLELHKNTIEHYSLFDLRYMSIDGIQEKIINLLKLLIRTSHINVLRLSHGYQRYMMMSGQCQFFLYKNFIH